MSTPEHEPTRLTPAAAEAVTTPLPGSAAGAVTTPMPVTRATTPASAPVIPDVAVEAELGRGGMGVVYRGRQTYVDRPVAVKVLSAVASGDNAGEYVQRFQREARILANLAHPHIVACYQAGVTADRSPYLVMEFIDGPNLWQWIRANGVLPEPQALRLVADLARALGYANEQGIIHRDVKPENVLLAKRASGDGALPYTAKLVDLGLARPRRAGGSTTMQVTVPGMVMGTPATMAPEQFDDPDGVDHRADIYGLGCVLYHALTGRPAFGGTSLVDIVSAKAAGPAPDPRRLTPSVSARAAELVRAMLAARREDRPQTYQAIVEACERAADAPARTTSAPTIRIAAVLVLVLIVAGGSWWKMHGTAAGPTTDAPFAREGVGAPAQPHPLDHAGAAPTAATPVAPTPQGIDGAASTPLADPAPAVLHDPASEAAAAAPITFGTPKPLFGAAFDKRLAGWELGPGWAAEEEGGDGVSGVAGGGDPSLCSHRLAGSSFALTGLLASGAVVADGRFQEAGVRLDLADGGAASLKVTDLGAGTLHVQVLIAASDGAVTGRSSFMELPDDAAGWHFALTVRNRTLTAVIGQQRANPLTLPADPTGLSLFVRKGAAAFRDLAVAYPTP